MSPSHYFTTREKRDHPYVIVGVIAYVDRTTIDGRNITGIQVEAPVVIRDTADTVLGAFYEIWHEDDGSIRARGGLDRHHDAVTGGIDLDQTYAETVADGTVNVQGRLAGFVLYPRTNLTAAWQAVWVKVTPA